MIDPYLPLVLSVAAAAGNVAAAVINIRHSRRLRRIAADLADVRAAFPKLLAFTAFASRPESGAPPPLQVIARNSLPPGVSIVVERESETRH